MLRETFVASRVNSFVHSLTNDFLSSLHSFSDRAFTAVALGGHKRHNGSKQVTQFGYRTRPFLAERLCCILHLVLNIILKPELTKHRQLLPRGMRYKEARFFRTYRPVTIALQTLET